MRFAVDDAALLDLMLATSKTDGSGAVRQAPQRSYSLLKELIRDRQETGELRAGAPERLQLLILAMFQGIAVLVSSRPIPVGQTDALITDAVALFVGS